jgi:hypothetical protein
MKVVDTPRSEIVYHSNEDIKEVQLVELMAHSVKKFWKADVGIMYGGGANKWSAKWQHLKKRSIERAFNICFNGVNYRTNSRFPTTRK